MLFQYDQYDEHILQHFEAYQNSGPATEKKKRRADIVNGILSDGTLLHKKQNKYISNIKYSIFKGGKAVQQKNKNNQIKSRKNHQLKNSIRPQSI